MPGMRSRASRGAALTSTGEELGVGASPGGLGVFGEGEVGVGVGGELGGLEAVEADEPVGLVEAVLADEGGGLEGEAGVGLGVGAEAGVVDAAELVVGVEAGGGGEDVAVGGGGGADDHLGGLAGGGEAGGEA